MRVHSAALLALVLAGCDREPPTAIADPYIACSHVPRCVPQDWTCACGGPLFAEEPDIQLYRCHGCVRRPWGMEQEGSYVVETPTTCGGSTDPEISGPCP